MQNWDRISNLAKSTRSGGVNVSMVFSRKTIRHRGRYKSSEMRVACYTIFIYNSRELNTILNTLYYYIIRFLRTTIWHHRRQQTLRCERIHAARGQLPRYMWVHNNM